MFLLKVSELVPMDVTLREEGKTLLVARRLLVTRKTLTGFVTEA